MDELIEKARAFGFDDCPTRAVQMAAEFATQISAEDNVRLTAERDKYREALGHSPCANLELVSDTCVYLADGSKVVIHRDGQRAWLEVVPQLVVAALKEVVLSCTKNPDRPCARKTGHEGKCVFLDTFRPAALKEAE